MKKIVFILFLILTGSVSAQGIKDFEGNWSGDLKLYNGNTERILVKMKLNITPSDSAGVWNYQMVYGDKDIRNYKLRTVDAAKNKYAVDEGNDIILSESLAGSKLISFFEVENSMLMVTLEKRDASLIFEVISLSSNGKTKSGKGEKDSPFAYSYPLIGYQKAILSK